MALATITVNAPSTPLATRAQEVALTARALDLAAQSIRAAGGTATSGDILDTGAVAVGSWVYTPQAGS
jgi:hypothetical protein